MAVMNMVASAEVCRMNGAKSKGPKTEQGKAISSRNATKHGLLAEQTPLLASEDLETFQGIMQGLINDYQPEGVLEWHCVQQIAMCIQRQHRLWMAEAAVGNDATLPPVRPFAEQHPSYKPEQPRLTKTASHPEHLQAERALLQKLIDQYPPDNFPTKYRTKYFDVEWEDWQRGLNNLLSEILRRYPYEAIAGFPENRLMSEQAYTQLFVDWLNDLRAAEHPYGVINKYSATGKVAPRELPTKQWEVRYYQEEYQAVYDACCKRLKAITAIESERQSEVARVDREQAERDRLTFSPIPQGVALLARYESHINTQLMQALERLNTLQGQRQANS